jgi:5,10-methylenetetrahydrofolate reductase
MSMSKIRSRLYRVSNDEKTHQRIQLEQVISNIAEENGFRLITLNPGTSEHLSLQPFHKDSKTGPNEKMVMDLLALIIKEIPEVLKEGVSLYVESNPYKNPQGEIDFDTEGYCYFIKVRL